MHGVLRASLILGALILLPIALYYRIKSQATREKLDRRQEGLFILLTLRPVGLLFMTALVVWMIDPSRLKWSYMELPNKLRAVGLGLGAMAGALWIWTFRTLGPNLTDTVVTRRDHSLVTNGPYRWVRHPFYDALALFVAAVFLITANWFLLVTGVPVLGLILLRTRKEEQNLLARFGEEYRAYVGRTGRFLPKG